MSHNLQYSLLRPSILHILRAAGFQSARPSVIDTLTDIAARYLLQLASITANYSINNHDDLTANVTDVRMAMQSFGLLIPNLTASEEHWRELLRRKLFQYSKKNGLRSKEQRRRDDDDTRDVNDFINWIKEDRNFEIRRIAGSMDENIFEVEPLKAKEDYVEVLKRKHSKIAVESRYQGTVLGRLSDNNTVKIEGHSAETVQDWQTSLMKQKASSSN